VIAIRRIRLSRARGWRLPQGAKSVARTTRWGNPYRAVEKSPAASAIAVAAYREWLAAQLAADPRWLDPLCSATALACWCPLDWPCHADVLLAAIAGERSLF
jgi:hypothetical protein